MDDLIRRSDVLKKTAWLETDVPTRAAPLRTEIVLADDVRSIPAVDAVEVVRCRECMYSASIVDAITHERNGLWCALLDLENVEEDFYCKDGQRRKDEHNAAD